MQSGPFQPGHVMMDPVHVTSQLTEKNKECRIPLCLLLIYFEEVFHSIDPSTVLTIGIAEIAPPFILKAHLRNNRKLGHSSEEKQQWAFSCWWCCWDCTNRKTFIRSPRQNRDVLYCSIFLSL